MSLLGIDAGTSGVKAAVFTQQGRLLASAYEEYDVQRPQPGLAELDAVRVWQAVKRVIRQAAVGSSADPIRALSVSSLGEAVVPLTSDRQVLGPSILNFDPRGAEFLDDLRARISGEDLYRINGNTPGNHYSLTKLLWIKKHQPEVYERAAHFLHWSGFISTMLGAEPAVDYSLANRSLLFDIRRCAWSGEMLQLFGLDAGKLPRPVASGTSIGRVSGSLADELGLPPGVVIAAGAHDQCANGLGCGVIEEGQAMYGMGTYICVMPVFSRPQEPALMIDRGLNTEHHAAPGRYVSYIYNAGGALLKWYRDSFAAAEKQRATDAGRDIYADLIAEIPEMPSPVLVLPHFAPTGPPEFIADSSGVMVGLKLETTRGEILKGILEGSTYYLKECLDALPATGIRISNFRAAGGGSKSDAWVQLCADILERPFVRPRITEAGSLGAAILAGVGLGLFPGVEAGVEAMVQLERSFEPDPARTKGYLRRYEQYRQLWPMMKDFLREINVGS
jgi:xylulokinase